MQRRSRSPIEAQPEGGRSISIGTAFGAWLVAWLSGNLLGSVVLALSGQQDRAAEDRSIWLVGASALGLWLPQIVALAVVSQRLGSARPTVDYGLRFTPTDLFGLPIGVASQVGLVAVYWPLKQWWPDTFSSKELERNARELYDRAQGAWVVLLIVVVVIGAPFVEELMYRGLLHNALARRLPVAAAVVASAGFFALIHFRPIEYPGLFGFGLVLGVSTAMTRRIGMAVLAHVAFNATGLYLVAR